ncbi:MAG TPA: AAA family ATPase [Gammaproteobacteria bacterium]|nr:AAA family ATPase [Gammaproteobacteria bacterium]
MDDLDAARKLVHALLDPACYPHEVGAIELVETHISWVLLTGPFAYKIKKPLRLDFLDFSTLEQRRHFCEEELRLNRQFAPELYLDIVPIGGTRDAPRIGIRPAIELAVKLRQFPADAVLDRVVPEGRASSAQILELAESIARFHTALPPAVTDASYTQALRNLDELEHCLRAAGRREPLAELRAWTADRLQALAPVFSARAETGAVRAGHGDLHLGNLVMLGNRIVPFDVLEFSTALRTTDVIDEAAFLVMDLRAHARPDLGTQFLNRYLEITGDYAGLRVLGFYLVYRALVRAKVNGLKCLQADERTDFDRRVQPYLRLADELILPRKPLLVITRGLSGSGKTTATTALIPRLGALRVRSDLERKRLHGLAANARGDIGFGEGRYSAAANDQTYEILEREAGNALKAGLDFIVDAAFLERSRRDAFRTLAARQGAGFVILECTAPEEALRERVRRRAAERRDASEATERVLEVQLRTEEPLTADERECSLELDTSEAVDYAALAVALRGAR